MSGLPDYDTDPLGALKWWLDHYSKRTTLFAADFDIIRSTAAAAITGLEAQLITAKQSELEAMTILEGTEAKLAASEKAREKAEAKVERLQWIHEFTALLDVGIAMAAEKAWEDQKA